MYYTVIKELRLKEWESLTGNKLGLGNDLVYPVGEVIDLSEVLNTYKEPTFLFRPLNGVYPGTLLTIPNFSELKDKHLEELKYARSTYLGYGRSEEIVTTLEIGKKYFAVLLPLAKTKKRFSTYIGVVSFVTPHHLSNSKLIYHSRDSGLSNSTSWELCKLVAGSMYKGEDYEKFVFEDLKSAEEFHDKYILENFYEINPDYFGKKLINGNRAKDLKKQLDTYISTLDEESKAITNILIKRGKEI